jgi:hypothetical protein
MGRLARMFPSLLPLILSLAGHAGAMVLHVPADHSTVGAALSAATAGDTIRVAPGIYAPSVNGEVFPLVMSEAGVSLRGAGMGLSILDAEGTDRVLTLATSGTVLVEGFTITGGSQNVGGGIQVASGTPEVRRNLVHANQAVLRGSGVNIRGGAAPWIHHNVIWQNHDTDVAAPGDPHGVQYLETSGGIFEHNLVGLGDSNGLITGGTSTPVIRHSIFYRNGHVADPRRGRGICALSSEPADISHNLFFENVVAAILFSGGIDVTAAEANDLDPLDGVHDNLDGDPLFRDPDGLDFHLRAGSPAVDAGDPSLPLDPDGTVADLGPFFLDQTVSDTPSRAGGDLGPVRSFPNPFNPRAIIAFSLGRPARVRVAVIDARGARVRDLGTHDLADGEQTLRWDGRDDRGRSVSSGLYLAVVRTDRAVASTPMLLVR